MKTIFRFLAMAMLLTAFTAVTVTTSFAQDPAADQAALYKKYTDNYNGDIAKQKIALDAAKEYVQKYSADPVVKEQIDYFAKTAIPTLEESIANDVVKQQKMKEAADIKAGYIAFNNAVTSKNTANIYTTGKAVLAKEPDYLDVIIVLANAGFDEVIKDPKSTTYNADVINYATSAIQKIEAGKTSKNYGALDYSLANKDNALRVLNYSIGFILSVRQDKKKEALPYFYKSAKLETGGKGIPFIYQAIGSSYLDEALAIDAVRTAAIKTAGGKDTDETLAMEANQRGYADRAIDAYARAYKLAKDDKTTKKEYTDGLYNKLTELYKFRYDNKTEGIDAFVATVQSKPLPDPATPITPVKVDIPAPATTPTTGTTTPPATPATKPPTNSTASNGTPKPAATTTTGSTAETKPATTVKPNVKKPTPKKKGTR